MGRGFAFCVLPRFPEGVKQAIAAAAHLQTCMCVHSRTFPTELSLSLSLSISLSLFFLKRQLEVELELASALYTSCLRSDTLAVGVGRCHELTPLPMRRSERRSLSPRLQQISPSKQAMPSSFFHVQRSRDTVLTSRPIARPRLCCRAHFCCNCWLPRASGEYACTPGFINRKCHRQSQRQQRTRT